MSDKILPNQKAMIVELLESKKASSEFEKSFMETMQKKAEKSYTLSFKQADILQNLYDKLILGNNTERTEYTFEFVTVRKQDDKRLWDLFINGRPYGSDMSKGDALSVGLWLSQKLQSIAIDWGFDDSQRSAIANWEQPTESSQEPCPF